MADTKPSKMSPISVSTITQTLPSTLPLLALRSWPYAVLPSGAYDTHVHVFDPAQYPYAPERAYSPAVATLDQLLEFSSNYTKDHLPSNIVLVQPSPYGTDNSLLLHSLAQLLDIGCPHPRGIAVVNTSAVTSTELDRMHSLGVRGLRIVSAHHRAKTEGRTQRPRA